MTRIGLIDVDSSNFPNLPLMKLAAYHKQQSHHVEWVTDGYTHYDRIYMSKVFTFTPDDINLYKTDEIVKGGTGYEGNDIRLSDEIEHIYPEYSLYKNYQDNAFGFLTRGCPRDCGFCIVSKKEGKCSRQVADLSEFWRGQKIITLLDPNLLACENREDLLQQLINSRAYVEFTQGLDIRLMDEHIISMIKKIRVKKLGLAWDNPNLDYTAYLTKFRNLTGYDHHKVVVYVLTNYNSTHEQDLYRVLKIKEIGFNPYVMVYEKETASQISRDLQRWCNDRVIFNSCEFKDYMKIQKPIPENQLVFF